MGGSACPKFLDSEGLKNGGGLTRTESSLHVNPPSIDEMLSFCVEKLWSLYDTHCLGYLDRLQSKLFVEDALLGRNLSTNNDDEDDDLENLEEGLEEDLDEDLDDFDDI